MELDDVRAFVSVADSGSVSHAARDLNVTQSAVTRRLQRLEASLGTRLLDRRSRPVSLTAVGHVALERCRRLLNDAREIRHAAKNDLPTGPVRIGVAHALTEFTLFEPIDHIRSKFPRVALRLHTGWSRELLDRVRSSALDAAVILFPDGEPLPSEVEGKQVGKERLVIVGPKRNAPSVRRIQDLAGAQWILNPDGCAARGSLKRELLRADIDMVIAVESYNYQLQLALVAAGRGLSLVPERILRNSRMSSRLRIINVPQLHFPLKIWTVSRQPFPGLDIVLAELSRALIAKL